jgi:hypothetical protein
VVFLKSEHFSARSNDVRVFGGLCCLKEVDVRLSEDDFGTFRAVLGNKNGFFGHYNACFANIVGIFARRHAREVARVLEDVSWKDGNVGWKDVKDDFH